MQSSISLNVGTNFEIEQIKKFIELNSNSSNTKIKNVFGSLQTNELNLHSARPDFRLSQTNRGSLEHYIKFAIDNDINVDYTVNAMFNQNVQSTHENQRKIIENLKYLYSIGIKRIIVANPLLMEIVSDHTDLKIKVSTIQAVNNVQAIKYYANYNVDCICTDIYSNRNIPLLKAMHDEGKKYGIDIELLANEICFYGDVPCSNVLRTTCYLHSSMGGNSLHLYNDWPYNRCQKEREKYPICWLKIPYILPQHMIKYKMLTGISHFKISGRTNTSEYLFDITEKYMQNYIDGNISELFMLPQNNKSICGEEFDFEKLNNIGFFDKWLKSNGYCNYRCDECGYCEKIYERIRLK